MGFFKIDTLKERNLLPGVNVRFVHTDNMTVAHWIFEDGAEIPKHSHPHEQVMVVLEGECDFTVDGETQRVGPGGVVVIPPNAVHSSQPLKPCRVLDVFNPVREDYR